jgi:hypothetical protein
MPMHAMDFTIGEDFWLDGCRMMAAVIRETLRLAKEPETPANVIKIVQSMLRSTSEQSYETFKKGFCASCLEKVYNGDSPKEEKNVLMDYYLKFFPSRRWATQEMIVASFVGILQGLDLEQ